MIALDVDTVGRQAWLRIADRKRKQEVLERMLKRVAEDKDMPPEDAPEYRLFRVRHPAAFEDARRFLEAELIELMEGGVRGVVADAGLPDLF